MDKYDRHIAHLTDNPGEIGSDWSNSIGLFAIIGRTNDPLAGCLTMIREKPYKYGAFVKGKFNEQLTIEIANDDRLPVDGKGITLDNLQVFAEWQRRIDILKR